MLPPRWVRAVAPLCLLLVGFVGGCGPRVGSGEAHNIDYVRADDRGMEAAIGRAVATLPRFQAAVASPTPGSTAFAVKVGFPYGGTNREHIWVAQPRFAGSQVTGIVNNEPVEVPNLRRGQTVTVSTRDISDWMYIENGVLRGGETIRYLLDRMSPSEREATLKEMGVRLP